MFSRKIVASAAALTLGATGLVACSNDGEGEPTSTEIVSETATETEIVTEGAAADASDEAGAGAAAGNAEATEEITTADGATAMVPAGVKETMDKYAQPEWGEPMAVEETDGGWIVTYDNEHYITWNENTGGAPTWGQIANEWITDVHLDKKMGFPVAPETENADKSGWTQEFENGTIEWTRGGTEDAFTAIMTEK
ncbi:LGFP repeat-containing protein [Corynebacterium lehmanniae]